MPVSDNHTFFGVYRGICVDNLDPENKNRIKLHVPQILGDALSDWAWPITPVTDNANHPDHKAHLASEVAALLNTHATHTATITSGAASAGTAHTHSVLVSLSHAAHSGNSNQLDHPHETTADEDNKWNDDLETDTTAEHTPHRMVPTVDQGVWVMFEGGDPNFPLWIGVF